MRKQVDPKIAAVIIFVAIVIAAVFIWSRMNAGLGGGGSYETVPEPPPAGEKAYPVPPDPATSGAPGR